MKPDKSPSPPVAKEKRLLRRKKAGANMGNDSPRIREEDEGRYSVRRSIDRVRETAALGENAVAKLVIDTAFQVHTELGPGLLESVYEVVMAYELRRQVLTVMRQEPIPIVYKEIRFKEGFKADLIVADRLIVELKSVETLNLVHSKQLLTQLRLTKRKLGLLINFGAAQLKDNVRRVVNGLNESFDR